jgi:hypothetical protein
MAAEGGEMAEWIRQQVAILKQKVQVSILGISLTARKGQGQIFILQLQSNFHLSNAKKIFI